MQNRENGGQTQRKCIIWIKYVYQKERNCENAASLFFDAMSGEIFLLTRFPDLPEKYKE